MTHPKDPVCGMIVRENEASGTSLYKDKMYYFCSEICKINFNKNPDAYIRMKDARERYEEEYKSEALEKMMDQVTHEIRNPLPLFLTFYNRLYHIFIL